jgi:hypothetical protein
MNRPMYLKRSPCFFSRKSGREGHQGLFVKWMTPWWHDCLQVGERRKSVGSLRRVVHSRLRTTLVSRGGVIVGVVVMLLVLEGGVLCPARRRKLRHKSRMAG